MSKVYVIHENNEWVMPLRTAFAELGTPFEEWFLDEGRLDLRAAPPEGVFYNRMSASSHTRGHRFAAEYTGAVLSWLERHGRTVVNGTNALRLEVSKVAQYEALAAQGIETPDTIAAVGRRHLRLAAEELGYPLVLKHNRGGKGLGVRLFYSAAGLAEYLDSTGFEAPIDGITLAQRYIKAPRPFITRAEFVGGRFLYAVRVDTSQGFQLCPADQCQVEAQPQVADVSPASAPSQRFTIIDGIAGTQTEAYERFLRANGIGIAGIEFVTDAEGRAYTYDVNTNTNYNPDAEARAGKYGMRAIARHLTFLLEQRHARAA
ncbi:MAG: alpha-L-glutamate ligase [Alphaproteobacteria bacterium]|nr:alpha-L-glutamate ligase [Alphaproteobacteria bacterium]